MDWLSVLVLCLVAEGLLPLLSPRGCKRVLRRIGQMKDAHLRLCGAVLLAAAAALLLFAR
ncbi:MAG: DUF2065 domain-containing protein [Gammaproteobacteria bacterium]